MITLRHQCARVTSGSLPCHRQRTLLSGDVLREAAPLVHFQSVRQEGAAAAFARHQLLQMRLVNGCESVLMLEHACKKHNRKFIRLVFKFVFAQHNGRLFGGFRAAAACLSAESILGSKQCSGTFANGNGI
jgi:hypothetical protein